MRPLGEIKAVMRNHDIYAVAFYRQLVVLGNKGNRCPVRWRQIGAVPDAAIAI